MQYTVYLSGPMTGIKDFNYPAFNDTALELTEQAINEPTFDILVENPATTPIKADWRWADYMRCAINQLMKCDAILLLPGFQHSRGARVELYLARTLGLTVSNSIPGLLSQLRERAHIAEISNATATTIK